MTRPAKKELEMMLTVRLDWCGVAFNATPEEAARQVVSDLLDLLARGGTVPVRIEDSDGKECELEVGAR